MWRERPKTWNDQSCRIGTVVGRVALADHARLLLRPCRRRGRPAARQVRSAPARSLLCALRQKMRSRFFPRAHRAAAHSVELQPGEFPRIIFRPCPNHHLLEDPYRSSAFRRFENVKSVLDFKCVFFAKIDEHLCTVVFSSSKIDEHCCTIRSKIVQTR